MTRTRIFFWEEHTDICDGIMRLRTIGFKHTGPDKKGKIILKKPLK